MKFSLIIKNGKIIDGAGNPPIFTDIGIREGKISKIGKINAVSIEKDTKVIDARNLVVCPGFIDMHSHDDITLSLRGSLECMIKQGVTSAVVGNCGITYSPLPREPEKKEMFKQMLAISNPKIKNLDIPWTNFSEYLKFLEELGSPINIIPLVGFTLIRANLLGFDNKTPTKEQLEEMKSYLEESMQAGAFGFSTGLQYIPQNFAKTEELIDLAKIVGKYNGFYFSHIRNQGEYYVEAVQELIKIVEESGCRGGQVAHLKPGREIGGDLIPYLLLMEKANERGLQIRGDQYPYLRASNNLTNRLPSWAEEGGTKKILRRLKKPEVQAKIREDLLKEFDNIEKLWKQNYISYVPNSEKWKGYEGLSLYEIAKKRNEKDIFSMFFDIIMDDKAGTDITTKFGNEEDLRQIMKHPLVMVGTDGEGVEFGVGKPNPRSYGTYPRILGKFVREEGLFTLEEAIRKMTALPAQTVGLQDRGILKENFWADIVIFNPDTVIDKATYMNPHQYPEGIEFVIVNGQIEVENQKYAKKKSGKILRRPW